MKRSLCCFALAALVSAATLAAAPLPAAPACPVPEAVPAQLPEVGVAPVELKVKCPRPGILCPDVMSPVICSDGQVYSNSCYAYVACATGCVPTGDV